MNRGWVSLLIFKETAEKVNFWDSNKKVTVINIKDNKNNCLWKGKKVIDKSLMINFGYQFPRITCPEAYLRNQCQVNVPDKREICFFLPLIDDLK